MRMRIFKNGMIILLLILFLISSEIGVFTSCSNSTYTGIFSNASYVLPGLSDQDLRDWEHDFEILESDDYGRIMYKFYTTKTPDSQLFNSSAIVICQKLTNSYSYYYDNICYLIGDNEFTLEQINDLKSKNDWGNPIDKSKLTKKKIGFSLVFYDIYLYDYTSLDYRDSLNCICEALGISEENVLMCMPDDMNTKDKVLFFISVLVDNGAEEKYFLIMDSDYKPVFMKFDSLVDINDDLAKFKSDNGWYN